MKTIQLAILILIIVAFSVFMNYLVLGDLTNITSTSLVKPVVPSATDKNINRPVVYIGVISRFAPNVIFAGYQPIMDYLNERGKYHYELKLSTSYQDAVDRLRDRQVAASFLGAWIYGHLEAADELLPVAAPVNDQGRSEFQVVLVTRFDSAVENIGQLRGKKVALPSAQSWSGNWLQAAGLAGAGLSVADLDSVHNFNHHQTVVWQVLMGNFDVGVVKESVAAKYSGEGLKSIARSDLIPGPPLVGNADVDPEILREIRELLLALNPENAADREILESWTPEFSRGFSAVNRQQYQQAFGNRGQEK